MDLQLVKMFSNSLGCHSAKMTVSFAVPGLFSFMGFHLLITGLWAYATSVLSRKSFLCQWVQDYSYFLFCQIQEAALMLRPLVCSWVLCRMTEMDLFRSPTRFLHCLTSTNCVLKVLSFLQCPLLTFCSNEVSTGRVVCDVWVFSCSTDNASVFRPIPGHFYYQSSTQYNLTTGMITHMAVLLLVRIVLTVFCVSICSWRLFCSIST